MKRLFVALLLTACAEPTVRIVGQSDRAALCINGAQDVVSAVDVAESAISDGHIAQHACVRLRERAVKLSHRPLDPSALLALGRVQWGMRQFGCD